MPSLSRPIPVYVAVLVAGLAVAVDLRYSGFVAIFTDPSGYVSAGARWRSGDIQKPVHFQFQPQFPNSATMGSPLAYRPGAIAGTDVVEYPLGLPVFLAASMAVAGEMGAYIFGPLMAGVLAMATYGVAATLGGPWAGVVAAALISASPVNMRHSLYVSSDVPCVAFWMIAWSMSLKPRAGAAATAGAAVTAAVMIRPNTAPLVFVIGLLVLLGGQAATLSWRRWQWRHAMGFGAMSAIGPILVLWSNTVFYGGPFEAGYKGSAEFFKWEHVVPNLKLYPTWLFEVHSVAALAGLAIVPAAVWRARSSPEAHAGMVTAVSAVALVALNLALIVPYLTFTQWTYLRFVLPAMAALFVLLAALVSSAAGALARGRWTRLLTPLAIAPAYVAWHGVPEVRAALREHLASRSVLVMGPYLRTALPHNAILSFMHSGSAAYYSGRPIVRLDIIQPDLDGVIAAAVAGVSPIRCSMKSSRARTWGASSRSRLRTSTGRRVPRSPPSGASLMDPADRPTPGWPDLPIGHPALTCRRAPGFTAASGRTPERPPRAAAAPRAPRSGRRAALVQRVRLKRASTQRAGTADLPGKDAQAVGTSSAGGCGAPAPLALVVKAHGRRDRLRHPVDHHVGQQLVLREPRLGVAVAVAPGAELLHDPGGQPRRRVVRAKPSVCGFVP